MVKPKHICIIVFLAAISVFQSFDFCAAKCFILFKTANLRTGPGLKFKIVRKIPKWTYFNLNILTFDNNWASFIENEVQKEIVKTGWVVPKDFFSSTPPRHGQIVKIFTRKAKTNILLPGPELGYIISLTSKGLSVNVDMHGGFKSLGFQAKYHPVIPAKRYFYRRLGQVFNISCNRAQQKIKVIKAHPEWSKEIILLILGGKIRIGMDAEQVRASWGYPDDINSSVSVYGRREQWVYRIGEFRADYLYFENGILTSYQLSGR